MKDKIISYIDENSAVFTELSDKIWADPELSLQEYNASAAYIRLLEENGFEVTKKLGGIDTAFVGSFGKGRPHIGFLGEFDALSGMSQKKCSSKPEAVIPGGSGHGCGHNMLGAGALCAAFALKDMLERTGMEGRVSFYGCPGEEGGASKAFLARDGYWKELDIALTWHPSDVNEVVSGTNNACIQVLYTFNGISAHAASDPFNGRSALDAVELMNIGCQYLREHMTSDCRIHYAITDAGGVSPNVVQSRAAVLYMIRANRNEDCLALSKRVEDIARGAALMTGTSYERTFVDGTSQTVPNFYLEELLYENFKGLPLPEYTSEERRLAQQIKESCPKVTNVGIASEFSPEFRQLTHELSEGGERPLNDFLIPLFHTEGFIPGSTDVGDVSWLTPTAQIHTTAFVSGAPGHSWQNVSTGGSTIGHKALILAGKVLALTGADLFSDPEHIDKAREEFIKRTAGGFASPVEEGAVPRTV